MKKEGILLRRMILSSRRLRNLTIQTKQFNSVSYLHRLLNSVANSFSLLDNSSNEYVTTKDGCLEITTRAVKTSWVEWDSNREGPVTYTKNYTSGMIQTWNKFCFTGGILELSIDLPGDANSGGMFCAVYHSI
jgi:beta-glucanase (GH16 family)